MCIWKYGGTLRAPTWPSLRTLHRPKLSTDPLAGLQLSATPLKETSLMGHWHVGNMESLLLSPLTSNPEGSSSMWNLLYALCGSSSILELTWTCMFHGGIIPAWSQCQSLVMGGQRFRELGCEICSDFQYLQWTGDMSHELGKHLQHHQTCEVQRPG